MAELEIHDVGEPKEDDWLFQTRTPFLYYQGYDESNAVNKDKIPQWVGQGPKLVIGKPGLLHSQVEDAFRKKMGVEDIRDVHGVAPWKGAIYDEPDQPTNYTLFGLDRDAKEMHPEAHEEFKRRGYMPRGADLFKFGGRFDESGENWTFAEPNVTHHEPRGLVPTDRRIPFWWYHHPQDRNDIHVYYGHPGSYHDEIMTEHNPYVPEGDWEPMHQDARLMDDYNVGGSGAISFRKDGSPDVESFGRGVDWNNDADFYDWRDLVSDGTPDFAHVGNAVQNYFSGKYGLSFRQPFTPESDLKFGSTIDRSPYVDELLEHLNSAVPEEPEPLSPHHDSPDQFLVEAGATPAQLARYWEQLQKDYGPDKSKVVHKWDDGWTVNELQTFSDACLEGDSMGNCLNPFEYEPENHAAIWENHPDAIHDNGEYRGFGNKSIDIDHPLPAWNGQIFSLRDPNGVPHLTDFNGETLGRHNSEPKQKYMDRWNDYLYNHNGTKRFGKLKRGLGWLFGRGRTNHDKGSNDQNQKSKKCPNDTIYTKGDKHTKEANQPNDASGDEIWSFHAGNDSTEGR